MDLGWNEPPAVEEYQNMSVEPPERRRVRRVWVTPNIMLGGSIQGPGDAAHLRKDFGITHVLNVETEHSDIFNISDPEAMELLEVPVWDHGDPIPADCFRRAMNFAEPALVRGGRLYVHCQMGKARSPSFVYFILRMGGLMTRTEALVTIAKVAPKFMDQRHHSFLRHQTYVNSADAAIMSFGGPPPHGWNSSNAS